MLYAEYHAWMDIGKWMDSRDLPAGNLNVQPTGGYRVSAPPKGECQDVQVAAARQSAATVLRTVQLYRAVDVVVVVCIMINFARSTSQMFQISPQ